MNRVTRCILIASFLAAPGIAAAQDAYGGDTLLIERCGRTANLPRRARAGRSRSASSTRTAGSRGGRNATGLPSIAGCIRVHGYFERTKVIDVVLTKADPAEIGPKPPIT